MTRHDEVPGPGRLALWGVKRPSERPIIPYLNEQVARYNCGPDEQVMHRESPAHPWEPVGYHEVQVGPLPASRPASLEDMRRAWPDKTDDELRAAAEAIAAAGGTLTVSSVLPEQCDECEETGQNCSLHDGPEWREE